MQQYQPITGRRIRFAIVGCGRISKNHFESLKKHAAEAELVAVCDIDPAALAAAKAASGVAAFARYDKLLRESDADVLVLSTPSGLHAEQTILA
ncbi:MAG: Gfo/Idh/MocA family protein, partial [Burkholderiales bacterium]